MTNEEHNLIRGLITRLEVAERKIAALEGTPFTYISRIELLEMRVNGLEGEPPEWAEFLSNPPPSGGVDVYTPTDLIFPDPDELLGMARALHETQPPRTDATEGESENAPE